MNVLGFYAIWISASSYLKHSVCSGSVRSAACQRMGPGVVQGAGAFGLHGPAGQMLLGDAAQRRDPRCAVVQAGDVVEFLAARVQEGLAGFLVDDRKSTR